MKIWLWNSEKCSVGNDSWNAVVNAGGYFIVDGIRPTGYLFGGNTFIAVASQQHNFIAGAYIVDVCYFGHEQVHTYSAAYGCPLTAD